MALFPKTRVPSFLKWIYPRWYLWDKKSTKKTIYLTFDDGPIPEVTSFVLDTLQRQESSKNLVKNTSPKKSIVLSEPIHATFFCIGDNIRKHPEIFERIIAEGHSFGNHTYNHLKGTQTDQNTYLKNTHLAELEIAKHLKPSPANLSTDLFRPPYGKLKRSQALALKKLGYQIIMYRVIAFDWEATVSPKQCLHNVISAARDGDIIVFHDSEKAFQNMRYALPRAIAYFEKIGFTFGTL